MLGVISIPGFQEPFSSLTHLAGAVFFALVSIFLLRRGQGNFYRVLSLAIFGFGTVFLLSMSGVYHLLEPEGSARFVMQRLDHAAIFILIAASFTPIHTILFRGRGRWGMLVVIWTVAAVSITIKMLFFEQVRNNLNFTLYLGMGWLGLYSGIALWRRYGFSFMQAVLWGGIAYSVGAILAANKWPILVSGVIESHEVFHVAVLIGLGFHWAFIYHIADGRVSLQPVPCRSN